jgi:hypothetical protein
VTGLLDLDFGGLVCQYGVLCDSCPCGRVVRFEDEDGVGEWLAVDEESKMD